MHIPFCRTKCAYCDFFSRPAGGVPDEYIDAVCAQARCVARSRSCAWRTIYIGGGTPSLLSAAQLERLCTELLRSGAGGSSPDEFTVELNPDDITREKLRALERSGVDRISIGVQSLHDAALRCIGRRCTRASTRAALDMVRGVWQRRLNLDVISGLPAQSDSEFLASLLDVIAYNPDHISLYALTLEEGTRLARAVFAGEIPYDEDAADAQWIAGRDILTRSGFTQYEISNFARGGSVSVHNSLYWSLHDYVGVGAGACGTFYGQALRYTNTTDIAGYTRCWLGECPERIGLWPADKERLDARAVEFEFLMLGLRTRAGVNSADYAARFGAVYGVPLERRLGVDTERGLFSRLIAEGRAGRRPAASGTDYFLTESGMLFLDRYLEALCAHIA